MKASPSCAGAEDPLVSVLMTVYNAGDFVEQAIASVLGQTWSHLELVVVDDGSVDDSMEKIHRAARRDARVRVICNERNLGQPASRNRGIRALRGDLIAFMDADDLSHPERLARQVSFLATHPGIDLVATGWQNIDIHGQRLPLKKRQRQYLSSDQIASRLLFHCPLHHPTLMMRARVRPDLVYDTDFPVAQDHELWSRLMTHYRFAVLPECLFFYRQHGGQAISDTPRMIKVRQRIFGRQLERLGVRFDAHDLYRHFHLFHFKGRDLFHKQCSEPLDIRFLAWADRWMTALLRANARTHMYPEPAFSHYLAARWLFVCRKVAAELAAPVRVGALFLRSPLARPLPGAFLSGELSPF